MGLDSLLASMETRVTGVTGVHPSNGAALHCNPILNSGVTRVTNSQGRPAPVTPATPCNPARVTPEPAPIGACTLVTPVTHENINGAVSRWWRLHFPDREPVEVACFPDSTHAEILSRYPEAIAAEPFEPTTPTPACSTCAHRPPGWLSFQRAPCGNPVAAGLSELDGVIRYSPDQGATCPAWSGNSHAPVRWN